ncbi:MAG: MATE family efflux transporter, partial [Muribaculaceae bacterium]|nr:MATE family efflux transporter [Muribaculaceae bacterium]
QSAQPIISYNYGAGAMDRVGRAFRLSVKVAAVCGIAACLGIALGARGVVSMFIDPDCAAGRLAISGLPVYSLCSVFFAINISFIGYYQSLERATRAMLFTLMRGVLLLVPLFCVMPAIFPGWGIWAAIPASEALTLAAILFSARHK